MEERSDIEQNLLETLINYNEALLDKKVPPVRPRQENVNEEENVNVLWRKYYNPPILFAVGWAHAGQIATATRGHSCVDCW